MCWKCEAVETIDDILIDVMKMSKYEPIVDKIQEILTNNFFDQQSAAIKEAIDNFLKTDGAIDEGEKNELLQIIQDRLGESTAEMVRGQLNLQRSRTYKAGLKDVAVDYGFNRTSKNVLSWMSDNHSYWIGKYYKEQLSEELGREINDVFNNVLFTGMSREQAGNYVKENLKNFFEKPEKYRNSIKNYFEGLANHVVTQTREFAHVDGYERAGIEEVEVKAVMDSRTSKICLFMNGKIIKVSNLIIQRNKVLSAKTPEQAKKYSPWLTDKEVQQISDGSKRFPKYLGLPPYHFFCRTTLVAHF